MRKIEKAIAVPIAHMVHPAELALGGAIALAGVALLLGQIAAAL